MTGLLESLPCHYSDVHILVTGNIVATGGNANTKVAFQSYAQFKGCKINQ